MRQPYSISLTYVLDLAGDSYPQFQQHRQAILAAGGDMLLIGCPASKTVRLRVTRTLTPRDIAHLVTQHQARAVMYRIAKSDTSK